MRSLVLAASVLALIPFAVPADAVTAKKPVSGTAQKKKAKSKSTPGPVPRAEIEEPQELAAFFERLRDVERGETETLRILWFGDSHVAADLFTGHARKLLQARFGDAGPGLVMPGNPWRYFRHDRARSRGDGGFETVGLGRDQVENLVGFWGVALLPRAAGSAGVEAVFSRSEVVALAPSGEGCLSVAVDGITSFAGDVGAAVDGETGTPCARVDGAVLRNGGVVAFVVPEPASEGAHSLEIRDACGGAVRILAADLTSGRPGILLDSIGINGAEIGMLGRPDRELRRALIERVDPALVVVSFGTNDMGRGDLVEEDYRAEASALLRDFREDAPGAAVLVTGPPDRASRSRRVSRLLAGSEPLVLRSLRAAARENRAAFFDQRAAMGGDGSIRSWSRKKLAARDLVHLSRAGYEKLAEEIVGKLLSAYGAWLQGAEGGR
jgi:lysophospholipase L1-like esterase